MGSEQRIDARVLHLAENRDSLRGKFEHSDRHMGILENIGAAQTPFDRLSCLLGGQSPDRKSSSYWQRDLALLVNAELGRKLWCIEDVQVQQISG